MQGVEVDLEQGRVHFGLLARRRAETMSAETASGPTEDQVEILEYNFNKVNKHPDPTTLCLIAAEAGLSEEETQKWFKQRLAQWRRSEGLPSECRSVTD
ncbi:homeodomain-only protein isoform X1 [Panthera pardus]|uniref:Homeodomain-only protein n=1 Tax=Panthera pardus TaxID=9691 RepID=A0A9V1GL09_PANPR|nr:homeodomain-only protein isoform X1 [Panthera pardus]XP_019685020.1 homeodomain-only protein isoform X1 [Felis catus]XP_040338723.1 homeodomain-only protein isoform X1 [Puma yagouaroundi]XP_043460206.1 homeodomain-only protein isoform X1 [Prionailurus bengalensis]XP_045329895.1 homeodomain-only protein isoform X1 [Leopardus geoffroyi]XP_060511729.1 homeodomain-only protein isoform X1 [Panthera onca]